MFVDKASILIKAGDGGNGAVSFRREKYVPAGGPDGGNGGRGGSVVFYADPAMRTLMDFSYKRKYFADNGDNGQGANKSGRSGGDVVISVPVGTVITDEDTGTVMANMDIPGKRKSVLSGGRGGKGNASFSTPTRKTPRFAQPGEKREPRKVRLELKSIADIGLVGFPNVGKSTFLSVVTKANPRIANYHFTTLSPNLGVCTVDGRSYVIADIPGLIEGAAEGAGLGHDFLRHIERTKVLIHIVDVSGIEGREPKDDFEKIMDELRGYGAGLENKPMIVAANKTDILDDEGKLNDFVSYIEQKGYSVFAISAATNQGITPLLREAAKLVKEAPIQTYFDEEFEEENFIGELIYTVAKLSDNVFEVSGTLADDIVARTNFDDYYSLNHFAKQLESHGIVDKLREMGAKNGDTVVMADAEFDFVD